jgi:hypothetical protein
VSTGKDKQDTNQHTGLSGLFPANIQFVPVLMMPSVSWKGPVSKIIKETSFECHAFGSPRGLDLINLSAVHTHIYVTCHNGFDVSGYSYS